MTPGADNVGVISVGDLDPWTFTAAQGDYIAFLAADDLWRSSWFPLLRLFGKGYLAVDLSIGDGSTSTVHGPPSTRPGVGKGRAKA